MAFHITEQSYFWSAWFPILPFSAFPSHPHYHLSLTHWLYLEIYPKSYFFSSSLHLYCLCPSNLCLLSELLQELSKCAPCFQHCPRPQIYSLVTPCRYDINHIMSLLCSNPPVSFHLTQDKNRGSYSGLHVPVTCHHISYCVVLSDPSPKLGTPTSLQLLQCAR